MDLWMKMMQTYKFKIRRALEGKPNSQYFAVQQVTHIGKYIKSKLIVDAVDHRSETPMSAVSFSK